MHSDLHRTSYWPKLTNVLEPMGKGKYEKNRGDMFKVLLQILSNFQFLQCVFQVQVLLMLL